MDPCRETRQQNSLNLENAWKQTVVWGLFVDPLQHEIKCMAKLLQECKRGVVTENMTLNVILQEEPEAEDMREK